MSSTLRLQDLLATEREQLARQARPPARPPFLISRTSREHGSAGREVHEQELAEAQDRRQDVVEVVRDAARELADDLQLLRLAQLLLERPLLGDVAADRQHELSPATSAIERENSISATEPSGGAISTGVLSTDVRPRP